MLPDATVFSTMADNTSQTDEDAQVSAGSAGIHSLLDLVFLATFETFDAIEV
jgi:hypothetical protein